MSKSSEDVEIPMTAGISVLHTTTHSSDRQATFSQHPQTSPSTCNNFPMDLDLGRIWVGFESDPTRTSTQSSGRTRDPQHACNPRRQSNLQPEAQTYLGPVAQPAAHATRSPACNRDTSAAPCELIRTAPRPETPTQNVNHSWPAACRPAAQTALRLSRLRRLGSASGGSSAYSARVFFLRSFSTISALPNLLSV